MECDSCGQEMKRIKIGGNIYYVCSNPDCNNWEATPELEPPFYNDIHYKEE